MEKRNTLLLTVIAIATLLVAVVGATFAYFSTTQDVTSNIPVDVTTASSAAAFTAVADGSIDIVVDAHEMQQADADDNVTNTEVDALTDTATLTVKLNAAQEGNVSQCKYSIIYTWTSDKYCNITSPEGVTEASTDSAACTAATQEMAYYIPTADVAKEFTLEAEVAVKVAGADYDASTHADLGVIANAMAERNLDHTNSPIVNKQITTGEGVANVDYVTLVKDAVIGSKVAAGDGSTTTATEVVWTFTARFYNSTKNQDLLMNKNFKGTISVDPDSVEC